MVAASTVPIFAATTRTSNPASAAIAWITSPACTPCGVLDVIVKIVRKSVSIIAYAEGTP